MLIRSNKIVLENEVVSGTIEVKDGKIHALHIGETENIQGENFMDFHDKVIMPGAIDSHTHIRFPGNPERETIITGTSAALAGGFTTIFEMPVSSPSVSSTKILKNRIDIAKGESLVDIAFYAGGGNGAADNFIDMSDEGAIAYKIILHRPPPNREKEFIGVCQINDGELFRDLKVLKKTKKVVVVHAEVDSMLEFAKSNLDLTCSSASAHAQSHPLLAELASIGRMILFAEETGTPICIAHVSSAKSAKLIKEAKERGVKIYAETCPHYLFASNEDEKRIGPFAKINPPLRSEEERKGLWKYLLDGTIDFIGTDHAPYTLEQKEKGLNNILDAPSGMPGIETAVPLLLNAVSEGKLSYVQLAQLISTNTAKVFGVDHQKGSIKVGRDADFIVVDPDKEWKLNKNDFKTKARETAILWDGKTIKGKIEKTILRGKVAYDGDIQVTPGFGEIVYPKKIKMKKELINK